MLQECKRPRIIALYMFAWSLLLLTSPLVSFKALEKIHHHHHPPCQKRNKQTNPRGIDLFQKLEKGSKQEPDMLFAPPNRVKHGLLVSQPCFQASGAVG